MKNGRPFQPAVAFLPHAPITDHDHRSLITDYWVIVIPAVFTIRAYRAMSALTVAAN